MIKTGRYFIGILLIIFVLASCKYEKLLKSTDYKYKYEKSLEYYYDGKYTKAQGLFDQLRPIFRATKQADTLYLYNAYASYFLEDYILAAHYFDEFYKIFGNSKFAEEAEFMAAYCNYKLSGKPTLDQSETYQAITSLGMYITRHPGSDKVQECHELIKEMKDKLVEKSYINAKLYYNMEQYKQAVIALNNSLTDFPDTKYREEIMYMVVKSSYMFADNSIAIKKKERFQATVDEYYSFINEFPESKFKKEIDKMYEHSQKFLKN